MPEDNGTTSSKCRGGGGREKQSAWNPRLSHKSQGETGTTGGTEEQREGMAQRPRMQETLTEAGKSTKQESEMQETVFAREGKIRWELPQPSMTLPKSTFSHGWKGPPSLRAIFLPVLQGQLLFS